MNSVFSSMHSERIVRNALLLFCFLFCAVWLIYVVTPDRQRGVWLVKRWFAERVIDRYDAGMQALALERYQDAEQAFSSARAILGPRSNRNFMGRRYAMIMAGLGNVYGKQGKKKKAKKCYQEALLADFYNTDILLQYGRLLAGFGDRSAEDVLLQAYQLKPANVEIAEQLMAYYASKEQWANAVEIFETYMTAVDPVTGRIENGAYTESFSFNNDGEWSHVPVLWNHPIDIPLFRVIMRDSGAELNTMTLVAPISPFGVGDVHADSVQLFAGQVVVKKGGESDSLYEVGFALPDCTVELSADECPERVEAIELSIQTVRCRTDRMVAILTSAYRALDKADALTALLEARCVVKDTR